MADFYASVSALQHELERAKTGLKDVDDNIKKLTGKDATVLRSTAGAWRQGVPADRSYARNTPQDRRGSQGDYGPTANRRVPGSAFSRLGRPVGRVSRDESADEDEELPNKPRVQSSVVNTPQGIKARKVIAEQQETREAEGHGRNRRMFGLLLGTLQSFRTESRQEQDKTEQRKKIHKKLEEREEAEKEELQHHTDELFRERRKKRHRLGLLEQKLELVQMHDQWEMETIKLRYFLCTKSEPRVFYMPKLMNEATENKFRYSASIVEGMIEKSRVRLEHEIEELMKEPEEEGTEHDDEDDADDGGANENGAELEGASLNRSNRIVERADRTHGNDTTHTRDEEKNSARHSIEGEENSTRHSIEGEENSTRHSIEVERSHSHNNNNNREGKDRQDKVRSSEKDKERSRHRSSHGEHELNRRSRRHVEEISSKRKRTDSDRGRRSKEHEGGEKRRRSRTESENNISDKRSVTIETRTDVMLSEEGRLTVETRKHSKSGDSNKRDRSYLSPVHEKIGDSTKRDRSHLSPVHEKTGDSNKRDRSQKSPVHEKTGDSTKRDRSHQSPAHEKTGAVSIDTSEEQEEKFSSTKAFEKSSKSTEPETDRRRPAVSSSVDAFEDRGRRVVLAEDEDETYPEEASGRQADE